MLDDYQLAWRDVLPIKPQVVGEEVNPGLVNVLSSSEIMMVSSFRLEMEDGGGELHIAFPYASLEPFRSLLDATTKPIRTHLICFGGQSLKPHYWTPPYP